MFKKMIRYKIQNLEKLKRASVDSNNLFYATNGVDIKPAIKEPDEFFDDFTSESKIEGEPTVRIHVAIPDFFIEVQISWINPHIEKKVIIDGWEGRRWLALLAQTNSFMFVSETIEDHTLIVDNINTSTLAYTLLLSVIPTTGNFVLV